MASSTAPKRPVENWEGVRDQWVSDVKRLFHEIAGWSEKRGWAILEEKKLVTEDRLGSYHVPRLLIHATFGRMVLDPVARYVVGANGLIELSELPSYETYLIARDSDDEGWFIQSSDVLEERHRFDEKAFINAVESFEIARR